MDFKFIPSPGIVFVEEIKDRDTAVKVENSPKGNVLKGKVLAVGPDQHTDFDAVLKAADYAHVGDTIFFLSYNERNYDWIKIKGKTFFVVKFGDIRGVLK